MPKNLVYHPSFKVINTPQISSQNFNQDFGNGFYVYFVKEDAWRGARRYPKSILNVYNL